MKRKLICRYVCQKSYKGGMKRAMAMLREVGRAVRPVMRGRGWTIDVLGEMPRGQYLEGLKTSWGLGWGRKIFLRLRTWEDEGCFFPFEEVMDTMLHE